MYDHHHKTWRNASTRNAVDVSEDQFEAQQNVVTEPADGTSGQRWDIFYCDEDLQDVEED